MYLNQEEKGFINYYLKKYEKFATGISRYPKKRNMQFLQNCLKVYYRLFGDNIEFSKLYDITDCSDKCRLYLEEYNDISPISTSDAEEKESIYKYLEIVCDNKDNYHKIFAHVIDFINIDMF